MNLTSQVAKHIRDIHFGGNWTTSNMKQNLQDVTWQEAITKVDSLNTIATLAFHVNYFVEAINKVLHEKPLDSKDELSFNHPPINSSEDWQRMLDKIWSDAETCASLVEQLKEEKMWEDFSDKKYGNYLRNLFGMVEHMHYHLGQIAVIKKLLRQTTRGTNTSLNNLLNYE